MQKIKAFFQGFIIGIGKIMPGVSGSVMAITFGIYEKLISSLSSFKEFKKNLTFLITLLSGIGLAIIVGSNAIKTLLENNYLNTIMFFIGMMIPGIFPLIKCIHNKEVTPKRIIICILVLTGLLLLNALNFQNSVVYDEPYLHTFLSLILCGLLDAASTVIPGISGSALLMLLGYYERIIASLASPLTHIPTLLPFLIGIVFGIILTSKLITYLFNNHRTLTYMLIIVFAVFSIIALLGETTSLANSINEYLLSLVFLILGNISTYILEKLFKTE